MPTVILTHPWTMNSTGREKSPGTEITFSRNAPELAKILKAGAGELKQGIPGDMPGRQHFVKAGFDSLQSLKDLNEWTEVDGIGEITAKKLDEYFNINNEE